MHDVIDTTAPSPDGASRLRRRAWPLSVAVAFVVTGVAYSLLWAPVVRHHSYWIQPGDIWATYRTAHYVGWGDLGGVYAAGTALVTFPAILLAIAPVAMITGAFSLSESFPKFVPHPTAWLALDPWMLILSAVALFSCDAVAERLGVSRWRRVVLCVTEACVLWNVSVIWGHPEDAVAVGLALYALVLAFDGRFTGAGWLFGAALATQPVVILMFPVLLALGGRRQLTGLVVRGAGPSVALLVTPLLSQFHATVRALLDQPNFPRLDHATPWTALAPALGGTGRNVAVAAGPGRVVAVVLACGLGWWARRFRHEPAVIVWAAALALALRCLTESVMVAFYLWPALAIGLVVAARAGRVRLAVAAAAALFTTAAAQWQVGWLPWWVMVTAGMLVVLAAGARPPRTRSTVAAADVSLVIRGRESPVVAGALP